jgi:predicted TIM-barrel fold metal-dependent hydrolase
MADRYDGDTMSPDYDGPIIDVHGHWGPWFFAMDIGSVEENERLLDYYGIDLQIVSASEAVVYDAPGGNARLDAVFAEHPRLRGYVVVNPNTPEVGRADAERFLASDRWVGVKIHTTYPGRSIASPQMRDTFDMLEALHAVVLVHTWGPDVLDLAALVADRPHVTAIAAHAGATSWDGAIEAAGLTDRLYLELSCSITDLARVLRITEQVDHRRLLLGTDATLIDPAVAIGLYQSADLSAESRELIFWRNAAELFGLDPRAGENGRDHRNPSAVKEQ